MLLLSTAFTSRMSSAILWQRHQLSAIAAASSSLLSSRVYTSHIFMVALRNRADHYILPCGFYLLSSFIPRLISACLLYTSDAADE